MRAFIALTIPEEIKREIAQNQQNLAKIGFGACLVKPENFHLTLAFLENLPIEKIKLVEKIIKEVTQQIKPVKLKLYQLDAFPSLEKAKVLFLSLQGELGKLHALALKIRKKLRLGGINFDEKKFVPHLTLARFKKPQNLKEIDKKVKVKRKAFIASQITLFESQLKQEGVIYKKIKCVSLA